MLISGFQLWWGLYPSGVVMMVLGNGDGVGWGQEGGDDWVSQFFLFLFLFLILVLFFQIWLGRNNGIGITFNIN